MCGTQNLAEKAKMLQSALERMGAAQKELKGEIEGLREALAAKEAEMAYSQSFTLSEIAALKEAKSLADAKMEGPA